MVDKRVRGERTQSEFLKAWLEQLVDQCSLFTEPEEADEIRGATLMNTNIISTYCVPGT